MNTTAAPLRVAMWSGPRNISTAMMRAWENRGDCAVSDEPLYAHYLAHTGLDHPARDEVIADGETDWRKVVDALLGPAPGGAPVWYQKHMTHHLLPHIGRDWIAGLRNVLLIRDPRQVVASYVKSRAEVTAQDIGLPQQVALYEEGTFVPRPNAAVFERLFRSPGKLELQRFRIDMRWLVEDRTLVHYAINGWGSPHDVITSAGALGLQAAEIQTSGTSRNAVNP